MTGKKQWIHKAMKNWTDGHDISQKQRIIKLIRDNNLRHYPLIDQTIFIHNTNFEWTKEHPVGFSSKEELCRVWTPFMPDLFFPLRKLIIELDGDFHTNSEKGAKRTKLRNQYYEYSGIKLISYVTKELDKMTDEELLADLKSKL